MLPRGASQHTAVILHIAKVVQSLWRKARQCWSRSVSHLLTSFISSGLPSHGASWSHLALYSFLGSVLEAQGSISNHLHPEGPFLTPYYPTESSILSPLPRSLQPTGQRAPKPQMESHKQVDHLRLHKRKHCQGGFLIMGFQARWGCRL